MAPFFNQATLSYNGNIIRSNITRGEITTTLDVTKTAVSGQYEAGDRVTYVVSIVNSGQTAFTGLTVEDNLGAYTFDNDTLYPLTYAAGSIQYYVNGVLQADPAVTAGPPLSITGINVPAGGNVIIIYEAQVNEFAPLGEDGTITNEVTVTGGGLSEAVIAEETISASSGARLTITKSLSPSTVPENGQITYTFVIENYGNTAITAADDVVITDTFDPILDIISVTFNGTPWTEPTNYTYNEATGLFTTVEGQITVPAATFTQDPTTGEWSVEPGSSTLVVTGTI